MKRMRYPRYTLPVLGILAWNALAFAGGSVLLAADTPPAGKPVDKPQAAAPAAAPPADKPAPPYEKPAKVTSVDLIKGIGKFNLGQNFSDFAPGALRVVDPKASGVLLRVSPYGENYLVTDIKDMTWGNIPIEGMVLTFHAGLLIDIQVALKAKNFDFYVADRAFKEKYGPNDPKTFPVETWNGSQVQMTLIFPGADIKDANSFDAVNRGKIDLFAVGQWNKFEAARIAALKDIVDKRYQSAARTAQDNL